MNDAVHTPLPAAWQTSWMGHPWYNISRVLYEGMVSGKLRGLHADSEVRVLYSEDVPALLSRVAELEADNARLREVLKPFVAVNLAYTYNIDDSAFVWWHHEDGEITLGDLRRARAALPTTERL